MANWNPFAGLLSAANGNEESPYGVPQSDVRMAQAGLLGNLGATLLAAGQRISPATRAQLLGQLGPQTAQFNTDIYNAAQRRYQQGVLAEAQAKRKAEEEQRGVEEKRQEQLRENQAAFGAMFQPTYVSETEGGEMKEIPSGYGQNQILAQYMKAYPKEGAALFGELLKPKDTPTRAMGSPVLLLKDGQSKTVLSGSEEFQKLTSEGWNLARDQKFTPAQEGVVAINIKAAEAADKDLAAFDKLSPNLAITKDLLEKDIAKTGLRGAIAAEVSGRLGTEYGSVEKFFQSLAVPFATIFRQPGSVTEWEQKLYLGAAMSISNSKETNLLKVKLIEKMRDRAREIQDLRMQNLDDPLINRKIAALEGKPIFSEQETQELTKLAFPNAPPINTVKTGDDGTFKFRGGDPYSKGNWIKVS